VVRFHEWKIKVLQVLMRQVTSVADPKERSELDLLIDKLNTIGPEELSSFLKRLYIYCKNYDRLEVCKELGEETIEFD